MKIPKCKRLSRRKEKKIGKTYMQGISCKHPKTKSERLQKAEMMTKVYTCRTRKKRVSSKTRKYISPKKLKMSKQAHKTQRKE